MLRNSPFVGTFPILQAFGAQPNEYAAVSCGGVALRGHQGIDFAAPLGTEILAVQAGQVLATGHEEHGFGHYVLLGHDWGQSLYAHLGEVLVHHGAQIGAGQRIARSGQSGAAQTPHLHFGLRIHPFSIEDGWCGYTNPQPYLDRLTQARGAIIGPHIIGGVHQHLDLLNRWQPRAILVLDPSPSEMALLREACPEAVIVGRVYAPDGEIDQRIRQNPREAAQWAHDKILARFAPQVDYWQFANEILQRDDGLPLLNEFELQRMALAEEHEYQCAILAFSVGNPDLPEDDRMAMWRLVYPALAHAEAHGHVVAIHQYGAPDLFRPAQDWYALRLEHQVLRRLPYKQLQFVITEYGIDGLIDGRSQPTGWQGFTDAPSYVDQLLRAGRYLERFSGQILGYTVFTLGHNSPWGTYDIAGEVARGLAERSERGTWAQVTVATEGLATSDGDQTTSPGSTLGPSPTEPEEPTDPVEPAPPDEPEPPPQPPVITRQLGDWVAHLNLRIRSIAERPDRPTGEIHYLIKEIFTTRDGSWEPSNKVGSVNQWARERHLKPWGAPDYFADAGADHHLFGAVIGLDGQLIRDQEIRFWSDGYEKLGDPNYRGYEIRRTRLDSGWANVETGPGSNYVPERGEMGPWCWAPSGAAEVICGGGMPAKQHISFFVVWQAVRINEPAPQPPKPPGDFTIFLPVVGGGSLARGAAPQPRSISEAESDPTARVQLGLLRAAAWNRLGIEYRADSPLAEYARRNALGMPVTQEFLVDPWVVQGFQGGIVYVLSGDPTQIRHISW